MNRHEKNNEQPRATESADKSKKASPSETNKRRNTTKMETLASKQSKGADEMSTSPVKVEVQRTFLTPRGRRFPPRARREFELSSPDNLRAAVREKVTQLFLKLPAKFTMLVKGVDGELAPCDEDSQLLQALDNSQDATLRLFVQCECPKRAIHAVEPVTCSSCHGDVAGARTKCLQCPDYNLCVGCDDSGIHGDHVMVRSDKPWFFKVGLARFSDAIPALCEKHLAENSGSGPVPRLVPQDIRLFWQSQHKGQGQERPQGQDGHSQQGMHKMWRMFLTRIGDGENIPDDKIGCGKGPRKPTCDWKNAEQPKCSGCDVIISGRRTKCLQCPEYDLCQECDSQQLHGHHVMVTGDRPRFFHFALPRFGDIIPLLCEKHISANQGTEQLPRLSAREVRQFWQSERKRSCPDQASPPHQGPPGHPMKRMMRMWRQDGPHCWGKLGGADGKKERESSPDKMEEGGDDSKEEGQGQGRHKIIHQMKRQWIQKSMLLWREQLQKMHEAEGAGKPGQGKPPMRIWRPYMRQCWDQWQCSMTEAGLTADDLPGPRKVRESVQSSEGKATHPRHQWIENCWKMWRTEASKLGQNEDGNDEGAQETPARATGGHHGRPFPAYWMMMQRSWRLMVDQMRSHRLQSEAGEVGGHAGVAEKTSDEEKADGKSSVPDMEPQVAKQMLKRCWVNGCRQLWWLHVKQLGLPVSEEAAGREEDAMKAMSEHGKWKAYMQDCWKLWKQLSNQAGIAGKQLEVEATKMDVEDGSGSRMMPPKQQWLKEAWVVWKDKKAYHVSKKNSTDTEVVPKPERQQNNVRPFPGWHPLIIDSWKMMQDKLKSNQATDQAASIKAAWMKKLDRSMKQLTMEQSDLQEVSAEVPTDVPKADADYQTTRAQLPKQLMEQYWSMIKTWQNSGASSEDSSPRCWRQGWRQWKKHGMAGTRNCHGARGRQGPRLRMTLSMRPQPEQLDDM